MKKKIFWWEIIGFTVSGVLGVLFHFLYSLSGKALWAAPLGSVNESTWEHMKLLFWAMFLFAIIQSFFFKDREDFWCVKVKSILIGLGLIPLIFYLYNGIIGKSPDWINIAIFFVSLGVSYIYEAKRLNGEEKECASPQAAFFLLCIIAGLFIIFSFNAPNINIFADPLKKSV